MSSFFLTVNEKVLIMFLMMAGGYLCGKLKLVTEGGAGEMTSVLFYAVTPCVIIASLQSVIGKVSLRDLGVAGLMAVSTFVLCILVGMLFFRKQHPERKKVLRFASVYSNCGFMGLPLVQAVMGSTGVAYASMFIAVFNLFVWTHGLAVMNGKPKDLNVKRALLNPGIFGLVIGAALFAFSVHLPGVLEEPIQDFSNLNTPLAMIVIGVFISQVPLRSLFLDRSLYLLSAVRLVILPALCLLLLLQFHSDRVLLLSILILSAAPAGANTVMFAAQFGGDTKLSSRAVALTTIFSLITMPLFPTLANLFH